MNPCRAACIAFLVGLPLAVSGCLPAEAGFEWGLSTDEVVGSVNLSSPESPAAEPLVVVFRRHYLLQTLGSQERIYTTTARLSHVDQDGFYSVPMPSDVVSLHILFIAADHLTREFHFERQIGIGRVIYRAELPHHPNWRSHFFTYLLPTLSGLIVEKRYRLPEDEQLRLGSWLQSQQARLVSKIGDASPAQSPAIPGDRAE